MTEGDGARGATLAPRRFSGSGPSGAELKPAAPEGIQLGARVESAAGGSELGRCSSPNPGKETTGSPRQSFQTSVAIGGRTGRFTNWWSKTAICT
jgi:hypothetical protein